MKKIFRKEILIGVSAIAALAILIFGIDFLKGVNVFKASNYYYVTYTDVQGLSVSAPVTVNGFKVGQVRDISYMYERPGHIKVEISLDRELKLPRESRAVLTTDLLGTASIALELSAHQSFYDVGSEIPGLVPKGMLASVSENLMPSVQSIFPKIDTLLTTLNTLASDPAIASSVSRLDAITANVEQASIQLKALMATLPPITSDVKSITGNVNRASADLYSLTGKLNKMPVEQMSANLSNTLNEIQATSSNLRELTRQLNEPNSTLGMLTRDPALYNNLNATIRSLDSLFIDIKAHPKRYISIKLL